MLGGINIQTKVVNKNKYIIYNEDKKILTFETVDKYGVIRTVIPGNIEEYEFNSTGKFYEEIIKLIVDEEPVFLAVTSKLHKSCRCENGKLKKEDLKIIRNYYSYYKQFSKQDCERIISLSYEYGFSPNFYLIEELLEIIKKSGENDCFIRCDMKEPIEELQKRLNFIKY